MAGSSPTVTINALAAQMARLKDAQDEQRALLVDVLGEMLKISQVQAEANLKLLQMIEQQTAYFATMTNVGPGSTRTITEADEYRTWRQQVDDATRGAAATP